MGFLFHNCNYVIWISSVAMNPKFKIALLLTCLSSSFGTAFAETVNLTCTKTLDGLSKDYNITLVGDKAGSKGAIYFDDKNLVQSTIEGQTNVVNHVSIGSSYIKYEYTMYFKPMVIAGNSYGAGRTVVSVEISRTTGKSLVSTSRFGSDVMTVEFGSGDNKNEFCRARTANKF